MARAMSDPGRQTANSALTEMLAPLIEEARGLREAVHDDNVQRRRELRRVLVVGVILSVMMLLMLGLFWQNQQRAQQSRQVIRQSADTSQRIADCTTPGGQCYEQGSKRTAGAVNAILYIDVCVARNPQASLDELRACAAKVAAEDARAHPQPQPEPQPSASTPPAGD